MWMDDPPQWPPLNYPDLYHYLIKTRGVILKKKWTITKPYKLTGTFYFLSGWVQNMVHVILSSGNVLLIVKKIFSLKNILLILIMLINYIYKYLITYK